MRNPHVRRHDDDKERCLSHGLLTNICSGSSLDPVRVYEFLRLTALNAARCCCSSCHATSPFWGDPKNTVRFDLRFQMKKKWCASVIVAVVELMLALSNVTSRFQDARWSEALLRRYFPLTSEACLDRWCALAAAATGSDRLIAGLIVDLISAFCGRSAPPSNAAHQPRGFNTAQELDKTRYAVDACKFLASCTAGALGPVRAAGLFAAISPMLFEGFRGADKNIAAFHRAPVATPSCAPVYSATYFLALASGLKFWSIRCYTENLASIQSEEGSCQSLPPAHPREAELKGDWGLVFERTKVCALCGLMLTDVGYSKIKNLWDWKPRMEPPDFKAVAIAKCGHAFHRSCARSTFSRRGCPACELSTFQTPWVL